MQRNYFYLILLMCFLFSAGVSAQEVNKQQPAVTEGLNFYPNPVSNGKIYITSKTTLEKEISIFDVLGKRVFQLTTTNKELNISTLSPGVYIIKIKEGDATATRKLIVK
ncbi:MAG: secretion protein [Flavobacterium sp. BFFFF1]|uniref:T9SS type A sorting domain-containing protein n=1 Tax=unclassified Flavobacterium TaxID=196869 RepID=UPI000BC77778|nr:MULTISPECIES: T9SS type A sorting domain-containing protein [unclassified Flavobacterium]OYU81080.1 MAG: secretion protein [Flavobacterium sp. BFFFF1]